MFSIFFSLFSVDLRSSDQGSSSSKAIAGHWICDKIAFLALAVSFNGWSAGIANADWPQLLGPTRNGYLAVGDKFPREFSGSPKIKWQIASGEGYAGAVVKNGSVYLYDLADRKQRLRSVDIESGQVNWTQEFLATYSGGIDSDRGPKATPIATEDHLVLFSAGSILRVVDRSNGQEVWSLDLRKKYDVRDSYFGAGSTPLVIDGSVIVNVGGKKKVGIAAFEIATGQVLWESEKCDASYASLIRLRSIVDSNNNPIVIVPTRLTTFGLNATNGETLFDFPFGARGPTVNAATPIELNDGRIFLTASYGIGTTCVDISTKPSVNATEVFAGSDVLKSHYSTPVFVKGVIFGIDGREDIGSATLRCIEPSKAELLWEQENYGIAHLLTDGELILSVKLDGGLELMEADNSGHRTVATTNLAAGKYQSVPAWESNHLIIKDCRSGKQRFLCYEIR